MKSTGACAFALFMSVAVAGGEAVRGDAKGSLFQRAPHRGTSSFLDRREQASFADTVISAAMAASGGSATPQESLDKVKDMIRGMIAKQMTLHAESMDHKHFCDKEMSAAKRDLKRSQFEVEKQQADLDKSKAELAELKDRISELSDSIASSLKNSQQASAIRSKEHAKHQEEKAAYERPAAITREADLDDSGAAAAPRGEFEKRVKAETTEVTHQMMFEREQHEAEVDRARKKKESELSSRKVVKMEHDIFEAGRDLEIKQRALDAAKEYDREIKKQCVVPRESYEERHERRKQQIDNLKDAYTVLNGGNSILPLSYD